MDLDDRRIAEANEQMLRRQREFAKAATYVAEALHEIPTVSRVALFGSVASPLGLEIPSFSEFRRAAIQIFHECKDVDLAVWIDSTDDLNRLRKVKNHALLRLLDETGIGVADHQVDVFLFESGNERYLGRLCRFNRCPKGKPECQIAECGASPFLRQIDGFHWRPDSLAPGRMRVIPAPRFPARSGSAGEHGR